MRKYGVLLLVVCLAVCGLAAAAAYNSATVVSTQTLKVVNTDGALLALIPGTGVGNKDMSATVLGDGTLDIKFGVSGLTKNGFPGLQPHSVYQWDKMISIWNKSAETLEVRVEVPFPIAHYLKISGFNSGSNWFDGIKVFDGVSHTFTLGPDSTIPLTFKVDLMNFGGNVGDIMNTSITVTAVAK